jgi:hypothetical protein
MKRTVELDTMDVADRLNVLVDEAEMIAMAVSGMRTLGSLPGSEGVIRRAWAMHDELGKLSETIRPQAEVTEPDVA